MAVGGRAVGGMMVGGTAVDGMVVEVVGDSATGGVVPQAIVMVDISVKTTSLMNIAMRAPINFPP